MKKFLKSIWLVIVIMVRGYTKISVHDGVNPIKWYVVTRYSLLLSIITFKKLSDIITPIEHEHVSIRRFYSRVSEDSIKLAPVSRYEIDRMTSLEFYIGRFPTQLLIAIFSRRLVNVVEYDDSTIYSLGFFQLLAVRLRILDTSHLEEVEKFNVIDIAINITTGKVYEGDTLLSIVKRFVRTEFLLLKAGVMGEVAIRAWIDGEGRNYMLSNNDLEIALFTSGESLKNKMTCMCRGIDIEFKSGGYKDVIKNYEFI